MNPTIQEPRCEVPVKKYKYLGRQFRGRHMVLKPDGTKASITNHQLLRLQRTNRIEQ